MKKRFEDPELWKAFILSFEANPDFLETVHLFNTDGFLICPPKNPLNDEGLPIPLPRSFAPIYATHTRRWNKPKSSLLKKVQEIKSRPTPENETTRTGRASRRDVEELSLLVHDLRFATRGI
jgi:hypothetical protein